MAFSGKNESVIPFDSQPVAVAVCNDEQWSLLWNALVLFEQIHRGLENGTASPSDLHFARHLLGRNEALIVHGSITKDNTH